MGQIRTKLIFCLYRLIAMPLLLVPAFLSAQVSVTFLQTNATCFSDCDGSAIAVGLGGAFPYTYQWSTGNSGPNLNDLCAGAYTVTVTDANLSTAVGTVTILQPNQLSVAVSTEDQICGIAPDGIATAVPVGGTAPYNYSWSNNGSGNQITGLTEGPYTVTVTDFNGCTAVGNNTVFFQNEGIWLMAIPTDILCFGDNNGSVYAGPMTGTPPYTFDWGPGFPDTQVIDNLPPGTYTVTVTDINGCSNTAEATVTEPPVLDAGIQFTAAACGTPGSATVSPTGGTPGYTVLWINGDTTLATAGPAGPISAVVTDANGCTFLLDTNIPGNNTVITAATDKLADALCLTGGTAFASATGGSGDFSYLWSNNDTTAVAANLAPGTYTVTITDNPTGCTGTAAVTVLEKPSTLTVTATADSPATCLGGGSATAIASGGTLPYTYVWNGTDTTATATGLVAGPHVVVVTDADGCTASDTVAIVQSPPPSVTAIVTAPVTCSVLGTATAAASSGLPPYAYLWSSGAVTDVAIGLGAGTATVTVTDAGGCTATAAVTLTDPPLPALAVGSVVNATCTTPGSATAAASGGTPPYTYFWDNGEITATANNLAPGQHIAIVTDAGGCTAADTIQIAAPPTPTVAIQVTAPATCTSSGVLSATATGGTPPIVFSWSNNLAGPVIPNLQPGTYTVTATDDAGCTAVASLLLAAPALPEVTIVGVSDASCSGPGSATANVANGTPPFTYLWANGETTATATNLSAGTHTVTVTDANGCTDTASVTIQFSSAGGINIGDFVWLDEDQDGAQHPSEKGAPGITVKLIAPGPDNTFGTTDDIILATTVTDSTGKYGFACVEPGTYVVNFSGLPTGFQFTGKNKVNNTCRDSDAKSNGDTDPITIVAGQGDTLCIDAGIHVICVNVTKAGLICCNQTICEGQTPALLYGNPLFPPQGGVGKLEYLWMQYIQTAQGQWTWAPIPGATDSVYQPGPLFTTGYFMRCVRRENCLNFLESNIITITVKPAGSPGCPPFFILFKAAPMSNTAVALEWRTMPEVARFLYIVERSMDQEHWSAVGELLGRGDPSDPDAYSLMDYAPESGMNYYRVRRLGPLGMASVSEVQQVMLDIPRNESLAVYPNPVSRVLHIRNLMPYESDARVQLFTANGVLLHDLKISAGTLEFFEVPVADLPGGIYLARIRFGDGVTRTIKVSKF